MREECQPGSQEEGYSLTWSYSRLGSEAKREAGRQTSRSHSRLVLAKRWSERGVPGKRRHILWRGGIPTWAILGARC